MKYPIDVMIRPAIMRGVDKAWVVAGCMIPVPLETTQEDIHKWVRYIPPASPENVWKVPSSTTGDYVVRRWPDGRWTCDCPGYKFHKRCKHVGVVKQSLAGGGESK